MPVHDWTRVDNGIFHDFHFGWIAELRKRLNMGLLPRGYYALAERVAGDVVPDLLTLAVTPERASTDVIAEGFTAVLAPPQVRFSTIFESTAFVAIQRTLVIRRRSDDRIVALIEIVSRDNKAGEEPFRRLLAKCTSALQHGLHLLLVDLYPPTRRDPNGIHGALCEQLGEDPFDPPADKPLTLAAYSAEIPVRAFVEPVAVGDVLKDMPLYLTSDYYVNVPLEETYQGAYAAVPEHYRYELER